jgi:hypothetical protein
MAGLAWLGISSPYLFVLIIFVSKLAGKISDSNDVGQNTSKATTSSCVDDVNWA